MSSKDSIAKAARTADKLGIPQAQRHIMMCVDTDTADCASKKQMKESWSHLKKRLKDLGLSKRGGVIRTKTQCMDICKGGPIAVVYPEGTWYGGCTPEVLDRIIEQHLVQGQVVREHLLTQNPLCAAANAEELR